MRYFKYKEFDSPDLKNSGRKFMDKKFLEFIDELRHRCNFPFFITSGYRTQNYQDDLTRRGYKTAKGRSPHQDGLAADVKIDNSLKRCLFIGNAIELCHEMDLPIRIGVAGKDKGNFCHIDIKEVNHPRIWVY
tara:strand:+ start:17594 stop:17992 length:399 start_codon:yes stop_codon:yes gene_type:complete